MATLAPSTPDTEPAAGAPGVRLNILHYIRQLPVVNVIAFAIIVLTSIPVLVAQRLVRDTGVTVRGAAAAAQGQQT